MKGRRGAMRWGVAAALALVAVGPAAAAPNLAEMVDFFTRLAFQRPDDAVIKNANLVIKLEGNEVEAYRTVVAARLQRLVELTGMPIEVAPADAKRFNFTITFVREETVRIRTRLEGRDSEEWVRCHANRSRIVIATLPSARQTPEQRVVRCLDHEIMHSLGVRGHAPATFAYESIMFVYDNIREADGQTPWDAMVLQALYDPRLRVGATQAETRPIVTAVMAELLAGTHHTQLKSAPLLPPGAAAIASDYLARGPSGERRPLIAIQGKPDAPVLAAAEGIVTLATRTTSGEIWIDHPAHAFGEPYMVRTVYRGLGVLKVAPGERVRRGQAIATLEPPDLLEFETRITQGPGLVQAVTPHFFWHDGPGRIACFDPARTYPRDGDDAGVPLAGRALKITYPLTCG
ncbi:MAG: DUF2927 domain-containing protein [Alphaproteobacteria bacterium]|nr:DUF2927 domain-containing protein [Alphaproteobacteria bacterium]